MLILILYIYRILGKHSTDHGSVKADTERVSAFDIILVRKQFLKTLFINFSVYVE